MPAPDVCSAIGQELTRAVGAGNVSNDAAALKSCAFDCSLVTGTCPDFIAYPHNKADAREIESAAWRRRGHSLKFKRSLDRFIDILATA